MEDINIDGKLSPSELLKRRRAKLEERNRLMMEKKVEDIRVKQEIELTNKLQSAFDKNLLIAQEMGMGMTTINNELQKQGLNEQEIKKHLENVTNEVYQASGKDVSVTQSVSQDNNNLSSTEVTQVDNKVKQ